MKLHLPILVAAGCAVACQTMADEPAPVKRPNVVFIMTDQHNANALGLSLIHI